MALDSTKQNSDERPERFSIEEIEEMVHRFYARVQEDDLLGPVFNERIVSWPPHLERMVLFWRAVLRSERTFTASPRGGPHALHRSIGELSRAHFERWLALFAEVVDEVYEPRAAEEVKQAAANIGVGLSRHLSPARPGELPSADHD
jgi:hemoglobin